jgi:hypothetical protein
MWITSIFFYIIRYLHVAALDEMSLKRQPEASSTDWGMGAEVTISL